MVFRKPYAFLIKNFKKIHIFLLVLCAFIYYKVIQISGFVSQFMEFGSYDSYNEPISGYINFFIYLILIIIIVTSVALVFLLKRKNKPWKLYLLPVFTYFLILLIFAWTSGFFNTYMGGTETTNIRMIRDILGILSFFQYPVFLILLMRIFGIDLRKFNFNQDEEFLELDNEDREEFEISINIDKESFKRTFKRALRNINYFYQEHKLICNLVGIVIAVILLKNLYTYVFITNKSYKQGEIFNANGYSITINNSYYTDKDFKGDVISKKNNFVIIDMTIKNNYQKREVNLSNFHIMNGINNYAVTSKTYENDFKDLGKILDSVQEVSRDQEIRTMVVYRVDKKLPKNRFVLYYQELEGDNHLRKIKLKIDDVSEIKENETIDFGKGLSINYNGEDEKIIFDDMQIVDNVTYKTRLCNTQRCETTSRVYTAKANEKILYLSYASNELDSTKMIDFSTNYGKISYKDSEGKEKIVDLESAVVAKYSGKYLYLKVPAEIATAEEINIIYTIRNNKYIYNLKKGE